MAITVKTEIRFRAGFDTITEVPKDASENGLSNRLAIIQETYRPDKVDMYFDEALFQRLLDYAQHFSRGGAIKVIDAMLGRNGWTEEALSLEDFRSRWSEMVPEEREPPLSVLVEMDGNLILCIATEFWTRIGGPPEYHDSYTYSVYSREDLTADVRQFLAASPNAELWDIQPAA